MIRMACNLESRMYYSLSMQNTVLAPPDFGQARMATLGWLFSQAQKKGPAEGDGFVSKIKKAGQKTPPDVRALWDSFYLGLIRYDNATVYEAGKGLSEAAPNDPLALWAYLYSIGGRQTGLGQQYYVNQGEEQKDTTPPLERDELEHVLASYHSLKVRRPELVQAQILQHVFKELKRAKRVEEEERLYRDAITSATQLAQIAGVFGLAAERGDVDGLVQLFDRFERLQTGRSTHTTIPERFTLMGRARHSAKA